MILLATYTNRRTATISSKDSGKIWCSTDGRCIHDIKRGWKFCRLKRNVCRKVWNIHPEFEWCLRNVTRYGIHKGRVVSRRRFQGSSTSLHQEKRHVHSAFDEGKSNSNDNKRVYTVLKLTEEIKEGDKSAKENKYKENKKSSIKKFQTVGE